MNSSKIVLSSLMIVTGCAVLAIAEDAPPGVVTKDATIYHVKMATRFIVPADNSRIDQLRVWHALPTKRSWSGASDEVGASEITFTPEDGAQQYEAEHDSHHLLWNQEGRLQLGARYQFESTFSVRSVTREFKPQRVKIQWKDYETSASDSEAKPNLDLAKKVHPEVAKVADQIQERFPPAQAVVEFCKWLTSTLRYDASVSFPSTDVASTLKNRRGHCGHHQAVLEQFCARVGIPVRTVFGLNLYEPDGRGELYQIKADYTNIHTWAEVYFPGVGWVEVEPRNGVKAFEIPVQFMQNNRWFQNYSIWIRENGRQKIPTWTYRNGKYISDYGVEHVITYTQTKEHPGSKRR